MAKYRADARLTVRVVDVPVEIDDSDPRPHVEQIAEALAKVLEARLVLLDIKGARGGADGAVTSLGVDQVRDWEAL